MIELVLMALVSLLVIFTFIYGIIYVPSLSSSVEKMLDLAHIKKGEKAIDIGSGDGRIVIALAKRGAIAYGYEINPFLVLWSKFLIKKSGVKNAHIYWRDFWLTDLSSYDVICVFVASYVMKRMEKKLKRELKKNGRVICESFKMPTWREVKKDGSFYLYKNA